MAACSAVQVAVRVRDLLPRERLSGYVGCVAVEEGSAVVGRKRSFDFDYAFAPACAQASVYATAVKPLLEACKQGINVTVLAYGKLNQLDPRSLRPKQAEFVQDFPQECYDDCRSDWIWKDVYNGYRRP